VVNKLRYAFTHSLKVKKFKVGHAGTLDPMATGLLLIAAGKYTKSIDNLSGKDKSYDAKIKLGAITASYDAEAEETNPMPLDKLTIDQLKKVIYSFKGEQNQKPPIYSAIKINGKAAHVVARKGGELEMKPRPIFIKEIEIKKIDLPYVLIHVECSKGTYIRSLAHDIGQVLGCGAYLASLHRTSIDKYMSSEALEVQEAVDWIKENIK
jgi:tRNA pseudouridine55 synthase